MSEEKDKPEDDPKKKKDMGTKDSEPLANQPEQRPFSEVQNHPPTKKPKEEDDKEES